MLHSAVSPIVANALANGGRCARPRDAVGGGDKRIQLRPQRRRFHPFECVDDDSADGSMRCCVALLDGLGTLHLANKLLDLSLGLLSRSFRTTRCALRLRT